LSELSRGARPQQNLWGKISDHACIFVGGKTRRRHNAAAQGDLILNQTSILSANDANEANVRMREFA